jgi:hypothetical protein
MSQQSIFRQAFAAAVAACALSACGGGGEEFTASSSSSRSDAALAPTSTTASIPTLLDDQGEAMPSSTRPADAAAWTSNNRYATRAQAQQLARSMGDDLLPVEVDCCGVAAIDTAVGIVWALQAASNRSSASTYVLIGGKDQRLAAATVNRLLEGGLRNVWLVTSSRSGQD